jgi:SAM-dependent methyltransferase
MDKKIYLKMIELENDHWWFISRRNIIESVIKQLNLRHGTTSILEIGCGTGGNLAMLSKYGRVFAVEPDDTALDYVKKLNIADVQYGSLPFNVPHSEYSFDLILLSDVLEHVDEDETALKILYDRLKPDGWLLITVPALQWLWGRHDVVHYHKRRYSRAGLRKILMDAGFEICTISYYNFILLPIIALIRVIKNILKLGSDEDLNKQNIFINRVLSGIFTFEKNFIGRISFPIGLSLIVLAKRK